MVRQAAVRQERAGVGGVGAHDPPAETLACILKTSTATRRRCSGKCMRISRSARVS